MLLHLDDTPQWAEMGVKLAASGAVPPAYNMSGRLYVSSYQDRQWGLLSVPNALIRGVFDAIHEPGIELPSGDKGQVSAHITVFRPNEIEQLGGADKLTNDRGKPFRYSLGRLVELDTEHDPEVAKAWVLRVQSPELSQLRLSHGLTARPNNNQYDFHITCAVRRKGVLGRNDKAKNPAAA